MKNKLIKYYNEQYFRNFIDTDLLKLESEPEEWKVRLMLSLADDYDTELFYVLHDLSELMFGAFKNSFTPLSEVMIKVLEEEKALELEFSKNFKPTVLTEKVALLLSNLSNESYYVGGCVRDAMSGKAPKDVDFCTDTPMDDLVRAFKANGWKCDEVGLQFLVLVVSAKNEDGKREEFEIANFRKDKDNTGGEVGTMFDDAKRRDFTVNAGYVRISDNRLQDPNGQFVQDIKSKTLRFVGKAKDRLEEDNLRGWRFYRFVKRGWNPDKKSLKAVRESWNSIYINSNPERVRLEIEKMINQ